MKKGESKKGAANKSSSSRKGVKTPPTTEYTPAPVTSKRSKKDGKSALTTAALTSAKTIVSPALRGNEYLAEVRELQETLPHWGSLFSAKADSTRAEEWVRLSVIGGAISDKYAWAIPDERAFRIISNFAPLVEVAAGKGYWGRMLQDRGIDIVCFDKHVPKGAWTKVSVLNI
jgi:hypothetical protein